MTTNRYSQYLTSQEWAALKTDLIQTRGDRCENCRRRRGTQVHHLTYANLGQEEPGDVLLLCGTCHQKEHGLIKAKPERKKKKAKRNNSKKSKRGGVAQPVRKLTMKQAYDLSVSMDLK